MGLELLNDGVEIAIALGKGSAFGSDVAIVKAVEVNLRFFEKFKENADTLFGIVDGV